MRIMEQLLSGLSGAVEDYESLMAEKAQAKYQYRKVEGIDYGDDEAVKKRRNDLGRELQRINQRLGKATEALVEWVGVVWMASDD